jgi:hypothetical protein
VQIVMLPELFKDKVPPTGKVIYDKNTGCYLVADSLLLLRVRDQIDRARGIEQLAAATGSHAGFTQSP